MIYSDFHGEKLSLLGFGAMRLPVDAQQRIDEAQVQQMVDAAIAGGVNYFDTAWPYHGGQSERVLGRALKRHPRESYCLADKYPGHQISAKYDPAATFEEQLRRCGVEYFDFYLMHNVYGNSLQTYLDPRWGIMDYFIEQKREGHIRHLGFSTHGSLDCMETFLQRYGEHMEFCQIQLNYLDWTLQDAKAKVELLNRYNIPVWVMEPLRGGKLANLSEAEMVKLEAHAPGTAATDWAFRWLQGVPSVTVILSGMSSLEQMQKNIATFDARKPLSEEQTAALMELAEGMKNSVPCTGCRYCCEGCPKGLNIPALLAHYNDFRFAQSFNVVMAIESLAEGKTPADCIACGKCTRTCPQGIDIPEALRDFAKKLSAQPSWAELCRQREEAQKKNQ